MSVLDLWLQSQDCICSTDGIRTTRKLDGVYGSGQDQHQRFGSLVRAMKRIALALCLLCVAADTPPMPPGAPVRSPKGKDTFAIAPKAVAPPIITRTNHLSWDYWSDGVRLNQIIPVRIKLWHTTNLSLPKTSWQEVADLPPTATNVTVVTVGSRGFFTIGYAML
jgi:hypothetical protein